MQISEMKKFEEMRELLVILSSKLETIEKELEKYEELPYKFLETEAINKIGRYGKEYYKNNYLKNSDGNISDYMKSFLYLKYTEEQLKFLQKNVKEEKILIESKLNDR
jgi:hypothetical protein